MTDYDFKTLNDKEFEVLSADLLGRAWGRMFEIFKPGKDKGVDGRYFESNGAEVILQCKHWANTSTSQLIAYLKGKEKPKLDKLKPHRYFLVVSNPLSRVDKQNIRMALSPHIVRDDDIYGKEDLNYLLSKFPDAEKTHYKLWLHSASVLAFIAQSGIMGRSEFSLDEIVQKSAKYAITESHQRAFQVLEKLGTVIISGDPGVGKTTLAEHLCLQYVADDFQFIEIADNIGEAESVFPKDSKQIFYFDDFLGRNYLEALSGHAGGHLAGFIRRVSRNKKKRFILTSRSTILNQGKFLIDAFEHDNLNKNEFELRIQSLSMIDKARILYNHIWHSGLRDEFREEFYKDRRYRTVIQHRNFNPRLISYITDPTRREFESSGEYWPYIEKSLADPSQIWEHPFDVQLNHAGRAIVLLVVLNRKPIEEAGLAEAFHDLVSRPGNQHLHGSHDFFVHLRFLTGSFLTRKFSGDSSVTIDLFNPSIGDYVLKRYAKNTVALKDGILSLRSRNAIVALLNLKRSRLVSETLALSICRAALHEAIENASNGFDRGYVSILCDALLLNQFSDSKDTFDLERALQLLLKGEPLSSADDSISVIRTALTLEMIGGKEVLDFMGNAVSCITSDDDIGDAIAILEAIPDEVDGKDEVKERLYDHVVGIASEDLSNFIEVSDAYSNVSPGDYGEAEDRLVSAIEEKFSELGLDIKSDDAKEILKSFDIRDSLDRYFGDGYDDEDRSSHEYSGGGVDEVDDLFDRG